jgi:long-chain fatty acid transport protein
MKRLVLLAIAAMTTPFALAQNNDQINAGIQFNFSNPGARSLAMAGSFTAAADDATAAFTNPAGLTILPRKEVSVEGRAFGFATPYTDGGRLNGTPSGAGIDTISGLTMASARDRTESLSFLSYVYPWKRVTFAIYRHELAHYRATFRSSGPFIDVQPTPVRLFPTEGFVDLNIVNDGISAAYRITESLSIGAGASRYDSTMSGRLNRYWRGVNGTNGTAPGQFLGVPVYEDSNIANYSIEHGHGAQWRTNAGIIWRNPRFNVGAVFRGGPSFGVHAERIYGPADPTALPGKFLVPPRDSTFHVPNVYGLGLAFHRIETETLLLDIDRVRYSQMLRDFANVDTLPTVTDLPNFHVNDGTEIRLGYERALTDTHFLRLGLWSDPDHRIRYEGPNPVNQTIWRRGRRENHYTAGYGWVIGEGDYQIDTAIDVSRNITTFSLSTVARF